jgi:hypothetical protein
MVANVEEWKDVGMWRTGCDKKDSLWEAEKIVRSEVL